MKRRDFTTETRRPGSAEERAVAEKAFLKEAVKSQRLKGNAKNSLSFFI